MNPYKVFLKHVFGAKYEGVKKSVFVVAVVFLAIFATEIKMVIAPSVLFLTAIVFSAGVMWQVLSSKSSMENLRGALVLPFENRQLVLAYVFSLSAYTLLSKSALILALFFALGTWRMEEVIIALLCAFQGCLFAVMGYLLRNKAKCMLILLLLIGYVAAIFYLKSPVIFGGIVFVGLLASIAFLFAVDAYDFYNPGNAKKVLKNSRKKGSFFAYAIRYLLANKNYIVNTVGLCVIACVLPMILSQFGNFNLFSIGLAILSLIFRFFSVSNKILGDCVNFSSTSTGVKFSE